jgi:HD-GYP domain-containing protein (c-di-GMP phosphodiesterase class II)
MTISPEYQQQMLNTLVHALEMRDVYSSYHSVNVSGLSSYIGQELGLSAEQLETIDMASRVHDIGKMAIPLELLIKPGKINKQEYELIKTHVEHSYKLLNYIDWTLPIAEVAYQHHERLNGLGYPRGLQSDQILLESKIIAVADLVDAISSHRPYRPARGIDAALVELDNQKGIFLDYDSCEIAKEWLIKNYTS